jgi:hypothetical protein
MLVEVRRIGSLSALLLALCGVEGLAAAGVMGLSNSSVCVDCEQAGSFNGKELVSLFNVVLSVLELLHSDVLDTAEGVTDGSNGLGW